MAEGSKGARNARARRAGAGTLKRRIGAAAKAAPRTPKRRATGTVFQAAAKKTGFRNRPKPRKPKRRR